MSDALYAKSPANGKFTTLPEHSRSVLDAVQWIYGDTYPSALGLSWLKFFGLTEDFFNLFIVNISVAAVLHDIGKANNGFQLAISRKGEQVIRHEHLSALILWLPEVWQWLGEAPDIRREMVLAAVFCHHLKVNDGDHFLHNLTPADSFQVYCGHPDFTGTLQLAEPIIGKSQPDLSAYSRTWKFTEVDRKSLKDHLYLKVTKKHRKDRTSRNLFLAVKAGLIVADSAASALVREDMDLKKWICRSIQQPVLSNSDIESLIIAPRMRQIEVRSGEPFQSRRFQDEAGKLGPRALLVAGCGAGKTLAAWKWVQHQSGTHRFSRVLFLYPTRATATEGFRDYASWAGEEESALLHGASEYDLVGMFTNPDDARSKQEYGAERGLYALGYWPKRIFSATVDSFLSFMAHSYSSLCMLPILAEAVVIIDEVHSFDRSMFTYLEQFLKAFPSIPVLCMTASLTSDRKGILTEGCGLQLFSKDGIDDLLEQTVTPRYVVRQLDGGIDSAIKDALGKGRKVLWVVNTIDRCQAIYAAYAAFCNGRNIPIGCYHSRFRLMDRKARHEHVIKMFREHQGAALVAATQVCEMSLDLDADILVTEAAPVPSIIQRMGRCCRVEKPGDRRGTVYVTIPADEKPYTREELIQCSNFVSYLASKEEVSQDDLASYLELMEVCRPQTEGGVTGFLDSGWYAMGRDESFRDNTDFTLDCILDVDVEEFLHLKRNALEKIAGLIVPVPKRFANRERLIAGRFPVAPSDHYDRLVGFTK